jgi:O-antigen ligase
LGEPVKPARPLLMYLSIKENRQFNHSSSGIYRFGFYLLLILAPFLLGSNRPIFWGVNGIIGAFTIAAFVWSELNTSNSSTIEWSLPTIALVGMLIIAIWIAAQASSWTPQSWHHPVWFNNLMLTGAHGAISANPSQTWAALTWWSTLSIFVVATRIGTNERERNFVLELMVAVSVFVAAFGFVAEHFHLNTVGLLTKTDYHGWLTGTFVNRNSAASFISIGMIIVICLFCRDVALAIRQKSISVCLVAELAMSRAALYCAATVWLFFALLLTGSRGGIITGITGGILVLVLSRIKRGHQSLIVLAAIFSAAAISIAMAISVLQVRTDLAESTTVRESLYAEALKAIAQRPILGHGAGTYASIQPIYHSETTPSELVWDNAHSTVLEVIATLGIPVAVFAICLMSYIIHRLAKTWWVTRRESNCLLAILGVIVAVTLHAFVDFSLEIQAIALYVSSLVGLGMGEVARTEEEASSLVPN